MRAVTLALLLLPLALAANIEYGQWTGSLIRGGKEVPLYDAYYIYSESGGANFEVMASTPTSWGSGKGTIDASNVRLVLDATTTLVGTISEGGTRIDWDNESRWRLSNVHTVHVVFMNHLDVGYNGIPATGFINNVLNVYFHSHFPRALRLQAALRVAGYKERFIYTTHPWLVSMYIDCPKLTLSGVTLQCPTSEAVADFVAAIRRGDITWHAGPFNLQPENMDPSLFEYGLTIAKDLDSMFNITRKFGVLSQRDVPGMTRSVIPLLVKNNVLGITVGQNGGTPPVAVPKLFVWRDPASNTEVITMYHPFGYGGIERVDDPIATNGVALAYAFRTDNSGPPTSIQEFFDYFSSLRGSFPGANIFASTYENFVEDVMAVKDSLPVIDFEIGDVWIDGISSDPLKETQFREISRARTECLASGACDPSDSFIKAFSRYLIKIPEHTWGLPGVYDSANWSNEQFERARGGQNYKNCESAWFEQREFNQLAIDALGTHPLAQEINSRLEKITPQIPSTAGMQKLTNFKTILKCGNNVSMQFDGTQGGIVSFYDGSIQWASPQNPLFALSYTSFNQTDFTYMQAYYGSNAGYSKYNSTCGPGCANPQDAHWPFSMMELWWNPSNCSGVTRLDSTATAYEKYGAPRNAYLSFSLSSTKGGASLSVNLVLWKKTSTRLPEQLMLSFLPSPSLSWEMDKLGSWVSPCDVGLNGSQYQHAVWSGFKGTHQSGPMLSVDTLDAPLISPITTQKPYTGWFGTPTVMPVPTAPIKAYGNVVGMASNLFNNVWDTNYILWYPYLQGSNDANMLFRYVLNTINQ